MRVMSPSKRARNRRLARRQQPELLDAFKRALRFRIEATDAIDPIIEQVHADRHGRTHRIDVEQRASQRELTRTSNLADTRIAGLRQP